MQNNRWPVFRISRVDGRRMVGGPITRTTSKGPCLLLTAANEADVGCLLHCSLVKRSASSQTPDEVLVNLAL